MACEVACPSCASLRAALLQIVSGGGVSELSLSRLCALTGLSEAAFREHYPTVAACVRDTYDEIVDELFAEFVAAFGESSSWADGVMLGMERLLGRMSERPGEAQLVFVEVLFGDRSLLRRREVARRRMVSLLSAEHRRQDDSVHPRDLQHELLLGAVFRLIAGNVASGRIEELPDLTDNLAELMGVFEPIAA
jgi:AcrR family transcriptional regulator